MYNLLIKRGQMFAFLLGLIIVVLYLIIANSGLDAWIGAGSPEDGDLFNFGLKAAIALVILCAVAAILFGLFQLATNPKGALKSIIFVVALLAVFGIAYAMANPEAVGSMVGTFEKFEITEGISKFISGAMTTTGILGALAIGALVLSEVRNLLK